MNKSKTRFLTGTITSTCSSMLWWDASCVRVCVRVYSCSSSQSQTSLSSVRQPPACADATGSLASQRLSQFLQPFFQLQRKLLVTLLTNGLHVKLNKLVPVGRKMHRYCRPSGATLRLSSSHTSSVSLFGCFDNIQCYLLFHFYHISSFYVQIYAAGPNKDRVGFTAERPTCSIQTCKQFTHCIVLNKHEKKCLFVIVNNDTCAVMIQRAHTVFPTCSSCHCYRTKRLKKENVYNVFIMCSRTWCHQWCSLWLCFFVFL